MATEFILTSMIDEHKAIMVYKAVKDSHIPSKQLMLTWHLKKETYECSSEIPLPKLDDGWDFPDQGSDAKNQEWAVKIAKIGVDAWLNVSHGHEAKPKPKKPSQGRKKAAIQPTEAENIAQPGAEENPRLEAENGGAAAAPPNDPLAQS